MGYQLRDRWLEWHNFTPMTEIESLKKQIAYILHEIDKIELKAVKGPEDDAAIAVLIEILATLERLLPPF